MIEVTSVARTARLLGVCLFAPPACQGAPAPAPAASKDAPAVTTPTVPDAPVAAPTWTDAGRGLSVRNSIESWKGGVQTLDGPTASLFGGGPIPGLWRGEVKVEAALPLAQ